ncbi:MAG: hypothetical protein ACREO3_08120 [Arenimonas sp.]
MEPALRRAVEDIGGMQAAAYLLWPTKDPILAGQRLSHCLDDDYREKLSLEEIGALFLAARRAGKHAGAEIFNAAIGYRVTAIVSESEEMADKLRQAEAHAAAATSLTTECMERMRHANPAMREVMP